MSPLPEASGAGVSGAWVPGAGVSDAGAAAGARNTRPHTSAATGSGAETFMALGVTTMNSMTKSVSAFAGL